MNLSELLKAKAAEKGMTPLGLATFIEGSGLGIHPLTVKRWFEGESLPSMKYADAICNALDIPAAELNAACLAQPKAAA